MVEAWRLQKHLIYPLIPSGRQLHLFLIFTDKKMPELDSIQAAVSKAIEQLSGIIVPKKDKEDA
jgi:hypothetical protein